jgi:hypothetical protein
MSARAVSCRVVRRDSLDANLGVNEPHIDIQFFVKRQNAFFPYIYCLLPPFQLHTESVTPQEANTIRSRSNSIQKEEDKTENLKTIQMPRKISF